MLLIHSLMFLPLVCRGSLFGPRFAIHYLVSFLVLQSPWRGRESMMPYSTVFLVLVFCACSSRWKYHICEQRMIWRSCTFAQSRQSLRWLHKKKGCKWRLRRNVYHLMWFRYLSHMRAAKDQASLHIHTVSPQTSLIALERRYIDEGSGIIVFTVMRFRYFSHIRASNDQVWFRTVWQGPLQITLKRRDVDEGLGQFL